MGQTPVMRDQVQPGDFGIPAEWAERAKHYAAFLVHLEGERCAALCEAQGKVYEGKAEKERILGREEREDKYRGYLEVTEWLAAAIRQSSGTPES